MSMAVSASFDVQVTPIKSVIDVNEEASFEIKVVNDGSSDEFRLYYSGVEWDVKPVSFDLETGDTEVLIVNLRPLYVTAGQHAITLNVKSDDGNQLKRASLIVNIQDKEISSYVPSVGVSISMPKEFVPNEVLPISLNVRNKNPLNLEDVTLHVDSDYFSESREFSLNPTRSGNVSEENIELNFDLDSSIAPQDVAVTFKLIQNNKTIYLNQKSFQVKTYTADFVVEKNINVAFFKTTEVYKVKNVGNIQKQQPFKIKIPLFRELFSSETPNSGILKEEGNRYFVWDLDLQPGEEIQVTVIRNYRSFLLFLLIIIIGVFIYFLVRSPLTISKSAEVIKVEEGGISMLKVMIKLKNISEKEVNDAKIYDSIPNLADYVKEEHMGSLSPVKVLRHENKGTLLKWEIPILEGFEERIITYKIKTQLNILGGLKLPTASGKFKFGKGKQRFSKSNVFNLIFKNKQ